MDAGGLGEDGDAALAFEVVGVHDALGNFFSGSENTALTEHGIDERSLAVIDVSDNGDISEKRIGRHFSLLSRATMEVCMSSLPSVVIVGRPNVGKSTLFNRLIGDERSIVHDMPGTTRDTIDTLVETEDGLVRFIDTAGMRRHGREAEGAEYYSMVRALKAIDQATLALLVIDAADGVTRQDQRLAERVDAAGNPIVVVLNKWDLLDNEAKEKVRAQVADMLGFVSYAPAMEISAKTGRGAHRLYPALVNAVEAYRKRVPTASLNRALAAAQAAQPAPHGARVLYATQGATDPPTFTLFTSKQIPPSYLRYLERSIREHFGFGPTPLKLRARRRAS